MSIERSNGSSARPLVRSRRCSRDKHHARPLEKDGEQAKFRRAQRYRHAVGSGELLARYVEGPSLEADAMGGRCRRSRQRLRTAEHGADTGEELARIERLHHVVVRADLEADDPVGFFGERGQQDHRDVGRLAQPAAERQAVLAGHHDVEDDEVDGARLHRPAELLPAIGLADAHAVLGEIAGERIADVGRIVDDENVRRGLHGDGHYAGSPRASPGKYVSLCIALRPCDRPLQCRGIPGNFRDIRCLSEARVQSGRVRGTPP